MGHPLQPWQTQQGDIKFGEIFVGLGQKLGEQIVHFGPRGGDDVWWGSSSDRRSRIKCKPMGRFRNYFWWSPSSALAITIARWRLDRVFCNAGRAQTGAPAFTYFSNAPPQLRK